MIIVIQIISVLYAIVVHEFSHALAANKQGDPTPRLDGRLTLNPWPHMDMFGTIILPVLLIMSGSPLVFGWAKPVMVNPANFRNQRWGNTIVSLAGPAANLISAVVFIVILKILISLQVVTPNNYLSLFLIYLVMINVILMIFNLIPIPPLDGSKLLFDVLPARYEGFKFWLTKNGPWLLLGFLILDSFLGLGILGRIFSFFVGIFYGLI
ncbi:MAG: site-2 protease family protein [Candidatus Komeilibacteria bacterium]|nr:site-2 protease family protein [Candidatus Komeilibacteria bacterium]